MTYNELINILMTDKPSDYIRTHEEELFKLIPELKESKGFNQNNIWHVYDVYEHILHVIDGVPNNITLRLAALFHDIGKPFVYKEDENGVGHFYGHWNKSKEIFENFSLKNNIDSSLKNIISNLIFYHDVNIGKFSNEEIENLYQVFNKEEIIMLFQLKRSDLLAQNSKYHYLLDDYNLQEKRVLEKVNK